MSKRTFLNIGEMTNSYNKKHILYCEKISKGISVICRKDSSCAKKLKALAGIGGHCERILASDVDVKAIIREKLGQLLLTKKRALPSSRKLYFVSYIDNLGITSDRDPVIYVREFEKKVRRSLAGAKLNAISVLELHSLPNSPGTYNGGMLLLGAHAVVWADADVSLADIKKALDSPSWQCKLGAKPVDVKLIRDADINVLAISNYVAKLPVAAKNMVPSRKNPGTFRFRDTIKGNRPNVALRLLEVLSQIDMMELISGVGEGAKIRQDLRSHVTKWHRERRRLDSFIPADFDVWRFWLDLRQGAGSKNYLPVRINTPMPKKPQLERRMRRPIKRLKFPKLPKIMSLTPGVNQRPVSQPKKTKVTTKSPFASFKAEKARWARSMRRVRDKRK